MSTEITRDKHSSVLGLGWSNIVVIGRCFGKPTSSGPFKKNVIPRDSETDETGVSVPDSTTVLPKVLAKPLLKCKERRKYLAILNK